jgi:pyrroline-5-carboxylate reductase
MARNPTVSRIVATTRTVRSHFPEMPEVIALKDNRELAVASDVIVLCVKPSQIEQVARDVADGLRDGALLVSVAPGISIQAIRRWVGREVTIVRAMPNTPCRIGAGITALSPDVMVTEAQMFRVADLFSTLGRVVTVEEHLMDAVTALSGCGPAYVCLILEALTDAGVSLGLPRPVALELSAQTLLGSAALVLEGAHPATIKDEVTTPAGCTMDALLTLEENSLRSILIRAVATAAQRSSQLGSTRDC